MLEVKGVELTYWTDTDERICRIVSQHSRTLLRIACTRLAQPADAEDAVQETFLRLMTKAPTFRDDEHEKAWLIRTTIHIACDMRKAAASKHLPLEDDVPAEAESSSQLLSAVRSLPEKYASVLHLHYYEGYSIKEIAKLLVLPAATVGTRLSRARAQLGRILKEEWT